jgi:hypothetical protein
MLLQLSLDRVSCGGNANEITMDLLRGKRVLEYIGIGDRP